MPVDRILLKLYSVSVLYEVEKYSNFRTSACGGTVAAEKRPLIAKSRGTAVIPGRNVFRHFNWLTSLVDPSKSIVVKLETGIEVFSMLDVDNI